MRQYFQLAHKKNFLSILFLSIFAFGLFLRLGGIGFALPQRVHEDESKAVEIAMRIGTGDLNPRWFGYPNGTMMYGLAGIFHAVHTIAEYTFPRPIPAYEEAISRANWAWFWGVARVVVAMVGALMVWAVSRIGRKMLGTAGALLSAWLTAIAAVLVAHSHFITPDITQALMLVFSSYFFYQYWQLEKRTRFLVLGSVFLGLAMGTKYPGIVGLYFPFIFILLTWRSSSWRRKFNELAIVAIVSLGVFFIFNPYILVSWEAVKDNLLTEARSAQAKHDGLGFWGNLWFYIDTLWSRTSPALPLLYPFGLLLAMWKKRWLIAGLLGFALVYILGISLHGLHWERWVIPAVPFFILAVTLFFVEALRIIKNGFHSRKILRVTFTLFLILMLAGTSLQMLWYTNKVVLRFYCRGVVTWRSVDYDITLEDALRVTCPDYGKSLHTPEAIEPE
ncbi:MAG: glycosyltransferase family 39 protein [bacterium]|nr:glycosyltransferase family 39 protein [bacterium]